MVRLRSPVQSPLSSVDSCAHTSVSPGHNTSVETLQCGVVHVRGPHYEQRNTTYSNPPMNFREHKDSAIDWIYKLQFYIYTFLKNEGLNWSQAFSEKLNCKLQSKGNCKCLLVQAECQLKTFIYMTNINSSIISQDHLLFFKLSPVLVPIGHNWNRKYQQNMSVVVVPSGNRERGTLRDWTLNISKKGKDCISS